MFCVVYVRKVFCRFCFLNVYVDELIESLEAGGCGCKV